MPSNFLSKSNREQGQDGGGGGDAEMSPLHDACRSVERTLLRSLVSLVTVGNVSFLCFGLKSLFQMQVFRFGSVTRALRLG